MQVGWRFFLKNRLESDVLSGDLRLLDGGGGLLQLLLALFLRVHGREEELEHAVTVPNGMFAFLDTADDPEAAGFGFFEGVETTGVCIDGFVEDDDLDTSGGGTLTAMHYRRPDSVVEGEIEIVKDRIDLTMVGFAALVFHVLCVWCF